MSGPHDSLFKYVFSDPENAASELRAVLPPALSARIDWASLVREPGSFVDAHLTDRHTDLLFSVRCDGHPAFLYLLLEHQSRSDPLMAFRLLRYVVRIWEQFLGARPEANRLPAVLPVVVYHSDAGGARWSAPKDVRLLLDLDEDLLNAASALLPSFPFIVDDLTGADAESLHARLLTSVAEAGLLMLARARTSLDLVGEMRRWVRVLKQIADAPNGLQALSALLEYAFRVGEVRTEDLRQFAQKLGPVAEEAVVTTAQKLKAEGRAEGKTEGKAEIVLRLLSLRFGALPDTVVGTVRAADAEQLDLWAERVLTASSLDDVVR